MEARATYKVFASELCELLPVTGIEDTSKPSVSAQEINPIAYIL